MDEPMHLYDGALQLDLGNSFANPEHPPLLKMLAAAAASPWRKRPRLLPPSADVRPAACAYLVEPPATARARVFCARLPAVAIGWLGLLAVALWGRRIGGDAGGLGASALLAAATLYGAHAHLVTTDVGVAALAVCGAAALVSAAGGRAREILVGALSGACLGGALAVKFSALLAVPAVFLFAGGELARERRGARRMAAALAAAGIVLWGVLAWGARGTGRDDVRRQIALAGRGETSNRLDAAGAALGLKLAWHAADLSPALGRYLLGATTVVSPAFRTASYPSFFHGTISTRGHWGYFPACLAFKLGTFAALAALAGLVLGAPALGVTAIGVPALFLLAALPAHYQLGARYLLPVWPFLALWAAPLGRRAATRRGILIPAVALTLAGAAASFPSWMGDSSLLGRALGPIDAWFSDSNLDWGQDLRRLDQEAARRGVRLHVVGGSEFYGVGRLFPHLDFPDVAAPLPAGDYSAVRWGPFLAAAVSPEGQREYPPGLRPLLLSLARDYALFARCREERAFSTASMRGFILPPPP